MHIQTIPMCKQVPFDSESEQFRAIRSLLIDINNIVGTGTSNNYAYIVTDEPTKQSVIIDPAHPEECVGSNWHQSPHDEH